jgi:NADPH:quinone reductase-like Zn-dependent oxidoreductase
VKAVVQRVYGSRDVLEFTDIDTPDVKDDEVLVRVHAAAVNPPDWVGVHGVPYIVRLAVGLRRPKLGVRGTDMAGIVDSVGRNATRLRVGDEVFGRGAGTFAEYAVAPEEHLVAKPAGLTFEQAAAVPMSGLTRHSLSHLLRRIRVCTEHPRHNDLLVLKELMESGKLTPIVGRTYPLSRAREAIAYFGEGHAAGKVVITVRERMSDPSAAQRR